MYEDIFSINLFDIALYRMENSKTEKQKVPEEIKWPVFRDDLRNILGVKKLSG
jgi:hypothetical protein